MHEYDVETPYSLWHLNRNNPVLPFWHPSLDIWMFLCPPFHVMWCVDKWKSVALLAAHMLEIHREEPPQIWRWWHQIVWWFAMMRIMGSRLSGTTLLNLNKTKTARPAVSTQYGKNTAHMVSAMQILHSSHWFGSINSTDIDISSKDLQEHHHLSILSTWSEQCKSYICLKNKKRISFNFGCLLSVQNSVFEKHKLALSIEN